VDAARTALRLIKYPGAEVVILYRRTRLEMPADSWEIRDAEEEGVKIVELTNPVEIQFVEEGSSRLKLICWKMKLGEADETGRRRPIKIEGSDFELYFDTIITAIGQQVEVDDLFTGEFPKSGVLTGRTSMDNVYIGGDVLRGPRNIITAIADGKRAADAIMKTVPVSSSHRAKRKLKLADYQIKSAKRNYSSFELTESFGKSRNPFSKEGTIKEESSRCLLCSDVCNVCVGVCPNRANVSYVVEPVEYRIQKVVKRFGSVGIEEDGVFRIEQEYQVLNIKDFCNECGNCRTFCPTSGAPYKDKPRLCLSEESFDKEANAFFIDEACGRKEIKSRREGRIETLVLIGNEYIYETVEVSVKLDKETFRVKEVDLKKSFVEGESVSMKHAAEMRMINAFGDLLF
jgi:putative selenate reductase